MVYPVCLLDQFKLLSDILLTFHGRCSLVSPFMGGDRWDEIIRRAQSDDGPRVIFGKAIHCDHGFSSVNLRERPERLKCAKYVKGRMSGLIARDADQGFVADDSKWRAGSEWSLKLEFHKLAGSFKPMGRLQQDHCVNASLAGGDLHAVVVG
jgi:hypothetical protein